MSISLTFADIIAPMDPKQFFGDYFGRKPCHIPGDAAKFEQVMSWPILGDLVNMSGIWASENLRIIRDREALPNEAYCTQDKDRRNHAALTPHPEKVKALLEDGCSLALNRIDTLTPGLRALANALESQLFGRAQINLYYSRKEVQAFSAHNDGHDVHAIHCGGEKDWIIYDFRADNPINHPNFKPSPDERDRLKGKPMMELTMKPGDYLYIPRGQYHEALSSTDQCVHLACGVTHVIGLDLMTLAWEQAMAHPLFRANVPPNVGPRSAADQRAYLVELAKVMANTMASIEFQELVTQFQANFRNTRGSVSFPVAVGPDGGPLRPEPSAPAPALAVLARKREKA
ncbi:MAG: cupin domain-containing protein [Rhodospirillum sp.]|nr:cupin domain-containing protein [Rhodospirillum sp.]MCF8489339.1 cupin domain-containing protein [Rhodospirillum sp.]MCF8502998.1 cupin domain-containing protein [Rhodospirillum sp.]